MKKRKGMLIADLHIGCMNLERQYEEIKSGIYTKIQSYQPDFIIFLGDYFDHKASLNDKLSYYSFKIFHEIVNLCEAYNKKTKIRFVYGTESHEWKQYQLIQLSDTDLDVKVITYEQEEELYPDMRVLYIPERQIYDKHEVYAEFLEKPKYYDYIFGHGTIREVMKVAAIADNNDKSTRAKSPVFSTGELMYACKGEVYFGHYHIHTNINDEVFYVGSYNRWCFGEGEDKGFYLIDTDGNEYHHEFIKNEMAKVYKTIAFGFDNDIYKSNENLDRKLTKIDQLIDNHIFDQVRFQFNIPENAFDPEYIIKVLQERYRFNKNIKMNIVHGYIEEKKKKEKEEIDKWNTENAPLFDENTEIENKVQYFIEMEYQRSISLEHIKDYLYKPLSDILSKK